MKSILKNFFIDRINYILFMVMNFLLIIMFYRFIVNENVEILYLVLLIIFLMLSFLVIEYIKYLRFNIDI